MFEEHSKRLLQVGGVALIGVGVCYVAGTALSLLIGPAPSGAEAYLNALSGHRLLSFSNFLFFALADVLLVPSVIALYLKLKGVNHKATIAASAFMLLFVVFDFAITELNSLQLVSLTQTYTSATSEAQRATYMATANSLLQTLPLSTLLSFVISSVALLIFGLVMLKGNFGKRLALFGVVIGVAGTLGGFYIFVPALALLLSPSMFAFGIWGILTGPKVYKQK
jgi:hypothetical protein